MIEIYTFIIKVIQFVKGKFDYLTIITIDFISFISKIYWFSSGKFSQMNFIGKVNEDKTKTNKYQARLNIIRLITVRVGKGNFSKENPFFDHVFLIVYATFVRVIVY